MEHYSTMGYMGEKRKALVDKYKFDTKNASHCIRLLRMCMEALITGEVHVFREDASQLLEIKRGRWSLEQVKAEADRLFWRYKMSEVNLMGIKEFKSKGFLQEANRLFFHPLGLALEVTIDEETGRQRLGSVWDFRGDPEGITFGPGVANQNKADYVSDLKESKAAERIKLFGDVIQPIN